MLIPEIVGRLLDSCKTDAIGLLLSFAKENYRDHHFLSPERINLLDGVTAAYQAKQWLNVVDFALVLDAFLDTQGFWHEDVRNLELALAVAEKLGPGYEKRKALVLHDLAVIYMAQGDDQRAASYFGQSLELHRQLEDKLAVSRALHYLGRIQAKAQRQNPARNLLEQSLVLGQEVNDERGVSATLHELGNLCLKDADFVKAENYYHQSLALSRKLNIIRETAATLHQLGVLNQRRGDREEALSFFEKALQMRQQTGHLEGIAESLYNLGNLAFESGLIDHANKHWQECHAIFQRLGMPVAGTVRDKLAMLVDARLRGKDA